MFATSGETTLLLDVRPQPDAGRFVPSERLVVGDDLAFEPIRNGRSVDVVRCRLPGGVTEVVHDAIVEVPYETDQAGAESCLPTPVDRMTCEQLHYTRPSRFCESDRLATFAWERFGALPDGWPRARAVCDWVHRHIEYRFGSGGSDLSAFDVFERGFGVCRDFAHLVVALCRALNLPARYVSGHLPDIGCLDPGSPMDFHACAEVNLGGRWIALDARYNTPRIGRIAISRGRDASDCAFATTFGPARLRHFEVWAYQIAPGSVKPGDPVDLTLRLDGTLEIRAPRMPPLPRRCPSDHQPPTRRDARPRDRILWRKAKPSSRSLAGLGGSRAPRRG